jgi:phospholipid/cholesterol/gamma-HCH transport system permease protein
MSALKLATRSLSQVVEAIGYAGALVVESTRYIFLGRWVGQPVKLSSIAEQMVVTGVGAIPIVAVLSMTIGLMLAIQLIATLKEFGAQSQAVLAVAVSVTREFGPLITGILVAGRSASALAARLGSMVVSQEIDALRVIGVEPTRYIAVPALIALVLMMPCLTLMADIVAIIGAGLYAKGYLDLSLAGYLSQTLAVLEPFDIGQGLIKAAVFGLIIAVVGVATGFSVKGGAEGVGKATTQSVVLSISLIVIADMFFTFFLTR